MILVSSSKRFIKANFHALTHKNFRYFWFGQCVSLIGTWMQNIGQSWLVLSITGSPFLLGLIGTFQFAPFMFFSLFAGVAVDRFPKKKILLATQAISMVLAFVLSYLVFSNKVQYWHVIVIAIVLGCANTIDMPTRQSFVMEIAGKEDLMNAIALNSATFNLARIIGPAIGAVLMAYLGLGWCFLLNGLSFFAVIWGLLQIKLKPYIRVNKIKSSVFKEIKDGLKYVYSNPMIFETLMMVTVVGIFVFNFNVLVPVFTKDVLHLQEKAYGFLLSSLGFGAFAGAILVSVKSKSGPKKMMLAASTMIVAIMLILIGISNEFYITALLLTITGIFNILFSTTANSTLQMNSSEEYRGRVMSVYSLVFAGSAPLGNLFAGITADKFGASNAFILSGVFTFILILLLLIIFKKRKS